MSTENYDLAICDDEVYWQKEILKYCKTIEKKKRLRLHITYFHLEKNC